jgi:ribosomal 30S subunit maturation factor RimM
VIDGDVMLPLVEGICLEVDMAARRIIVDPPEGLIELYRS